MSLKINGQLVTNVSLQGQNVVRILHTASGEVLWEKDNLDYFYLENETDTVGTFTCTKTGSPTAPNLEYSTDGVNWTTADMSATWSVTVGPRGNIYLRGDNGTNGFNRSALSYYQFSMNANHSLHGNIMSIQNYNTMDEVTAVPNFCFYSLFYNNKKLIDASNVNFGNVTSISYYGCGNMYYQCLKLISGPNLSNITSIGNYGCVDMFYGCSALTTAPDMSNVTNIFQNGCYYMFYECSALTTAPDISNVTNIGDNGCSKMFNGCKSLTTAPDMSNVTRIGQWGCSNMFYGCSALTAAPDMSNVTRIGQWGCSNMFYGCSALTAAPDMSNVTNIGGSGCEYMFWYCSKLQTIYAPNLATWDTSTFYRWVGVAGSSAEEPKIMYFPTQALMDLCPSGADGYGAYEKHLLNSIALHITNVLDGISYSVDDGEPIALPNKGYENYFDIEIPDSTNSITFHDAEPSKLRRMLYYVDGEMRGVNFLNGDITLQISDMDLDKPIEFELFG